MQWSINLTERSTIASIKAYAQLQLKNRIQIVNWGGGKPLVFTDGEKTYGDRLITDLTNNKFTVKVTNAQYNDSGNYSMSVISLSPLSKADDAVTVLVYGMFFFFCYFKRLIFSGSFLKANPSVEDE